MASAEDLLCFSFRQYFEGLVASLVLNGLFLLAFFTIGIAVIYFRRRIQNRGEPLINAERLIDPDPEQQQENQAGEQEARQNVENPQDHAFVEINLQERTPPTEQVEMSWNPSSLFACFRRKRRNETMESSV